MTPGLVIGLLVLALLAGLGWQARREVKGRDYVRTYNFHALLGKRLGKRFPQYTSADWYRVCEGLRQWFVVLGNAGHRRVAMPSRAVDEAWHEFIVDTPRYVEFCERAFGRYMHHRPAEPLREASESQAQLRLCWRLACENAGIDPREPKRLPKLFAIDRELEFPRGLRYRIAAFAAAAAATATDAAQSASDGGVSVEFDVESIGCSGDGGDGGGGDGCGGGCGGGD